DLGQASVGLLEVRGERGLAVRPGHLLILSRSGRRSISHLAAELLRGLPPRLAESEPCTSPRSTSTSASATATCGTPVLARRSWLSSRSSSRSCSSAPARG